LGLFFIAVGAAIDFGLIAARPGLIFGLVALVIAVKFAVLFGLGRFFGLGAGPSGLLAFALPQVGEFAFVLFSFAAQEGVLGATITSPLTAVVALSMAVTPLMLMLHERFVAPRIGPAAAPEREADAVDDKAPVLIAGFGSFGATVGRFLRANGVRTTVLDYDSDRVDVLRRLGLSVYYGDATRHDLLHAAGASSARLLVIALDSPEKSLELVAMARKHFPHLRIYARAFDWNDAHDLIEAGVDHVYRQGLDTSLRLGTDALRQLGQRAHQSVRAAQKFLAHDEESLRELTRQRRETGYFSAVRQRIEELEALLEADRAEPDLARDEGWDAEALRREFGESPRKVT
jgi:monovalent cation:H+ antiporter-2, CPA2 family